MSTPDPEVTARIGSDDVLTPRGRGAEAQFAPGTVVAGRYRIAGILGAGGMGEVYRADDTKLDQPVALKFLPARLARDPLLLGRLHDEVRLGRQIAHPNVCRIYDIVDWDGAHFLAMEYVDGEDLARLLRRIGRLAHDKAVDIARGIAAGLAAAHAKGILHRDLKPANVMIDSRGDARIMDFGLALGAGEDDGMISGTPAYMAPEQLEGHPATVQSDLYALGLVMYELFTGRRAHNARTMPERVRDITSEIATPSSVIHDIDPAVERIILRCLSADPAQRPASAREVIQALPGGDPLAAALAAGQTPSPRVVAAAGSEGSLRPWQAWSLLGLAVLCMAAVLAGKRAFGIGQYVLLRNPDVLRERSESLLRTLGIPSQPFGTHTLRADEGYLGWVLAKDRSAQRWEHLRSGPPAVAFRLVESAEPLPPQHSAEAAVPQAGMTVAEVDLRGRLVSLAAIPRQAWDPRPLDWQPLFAAAALDPRTLVPVPPRLVPPGPTDVHAAWSGRHPDDGTPIRVEAGAWRGRPVFFRLTGAWESATAKNLPFSTAAVRGLLSGLGLALIALALLLAWRNVRLRRGDRSGALRIAGAMFVLELTGTLLIARHHAAGLHEVSVLRYALTEALLWAAVMYVLYLALEPFARRRWPQHLIASGRLLAGNWRDPMVGRDVLIGIVIGLTHSALIMAGIWMAVRAGQPVQPPFISGLHLLNGGRFWVGHILASLTGGIVQGFMLVCILVAFMLVLRHRVAAAAGMVLLMLGAYYVAAHGVSVAQVAMSVIVVYGVARYGFLAAVVMQAAFHSVFHALLFTSGSWQSIQPVTVLFVLGGALWAFRASLGPQPLFSAAWLDE